MSLFYFNITLRHLVIPFCNLKINLHIQWSTHANLMSKMHTQWQWTHAALSTHAHIQWTSAHLTIKLAHLMIRLAHLMIRHVTAERLIFGRKMDNSTPQKLEKFCFTPKRHLSKPKWEKFKAKCVGRVEHLLTLCTQIMYVVEEIFPCYLKQSYWSDMVINAKKLVKFAFNWRRLTMKITLCYNKIAVTIFYSLLFQSFRNCFNGMCQWSDLAKLLWSTHNI